MNDLRNMKNPSEIVQQVWEAVCILLGLKGDWNAAKIAMGDANFIQKLIEFDKDNIPEQVMKRVRRYIDNPKFIPDEVGKISRLSSSLCMWVRAIDLYAKIFKVYQSTRYVFGTFSNFFLFSDLSHKLSIYFTLMKAVCDHFTQNALAKTSIGLSLFCKSWS